MEKTQTQATSPGKFYTLFVDDVEFRVEQESMSGAEIMALAGIPLEVGLQLIESDGTVRTVPPDEIITFEGPGRRLKRAPRFKRGNVLTDRLSREMELLQSRYGKVTGAPDGTWILFEQWPLPEGWNQQKTRLLISVPPGYPATPPDNFYTDLALRLADGRQAGNTSMGTTIAGEQWLQFSYHIEGGDWQPHAEPERGHNLMTFMIGVAKRLEDLS